MALLCAIGIFAHAQNTGSVRGTIHDSAGEPGIGLTVRIQNTTLGVVSDPSGAFVIHNIAPGTHTLVITGVGFKTLQHKVDRKSVV